jgi:hypothetical protein
MMNFRGAYGFQDGAFLVATIAIFALALPCAIEAAAGSPVSPRVAWSGCFLIGSILTGSEMAARHAITSPHRATREDYIALPKKYLAVDDQTPIYVRIRAVLRPGERLMVLEYNPDFFLPAGFLPVKKYHEFLPWEADYARHPWFGRTRDLCADITANPPPVIVYDAWVVWDRWAPQTFMPCVPRILKQDYVADAIPTLFIRRDRVPAAQPRTP